MKILSESLLIACFSFTSCAVLTKTETAKTAHIYGPGVLQYPVLADLVVKDSKVTGQANGMSSSKEAVRNQAIANAIKQAGADVLVEPVFEMQRSGSRVTAIVTGFPATYKNFRPVTQADLPMLETGIMQTARVSEVTVAPEKKRGAVGGIVVGLLLIGLAVAGLAGGI